VAGTQQSIPQLKRNVGHCESARLQYVLPGNCSPAAQRQHHQVVILSTVLGTIRLSPEHQSYFGLGDSTHVVKADSIASDIRPKTQRFRMDNVRIANGSPAAPKLDCAASS
jgi:hypothetical protein